MKALIALAILLSLTAPAWNIITAPTVQGTDAYYYALQADSWHKTGAVRIPDSNPLHPIIGTIMKSGKTGVEAVKIWQGVSLILFAAAFMGLYARRPSPASLIIFLWLALSPSIVFCALEFPKTFASVIVFTLGLAAARAGGRWFLLAPVFFLLACFVHRMAIAYALCALAGLFIYGRGDVAIKRAMLRQPVLGDHDIRFLFALACGAGMFCTWLLHTELARFEGTNLMPGLFALFLEHNLPLSIKGELLFAAFFLIWLCRTNPQGKRGALFALLLAAPAFIPALGEEAFNLGERFALLFPLMALISAAFLRPRSNSTPPLPPKLRATPTFMLLAVPLALFRVEYSYPPRLNPPYAEYAAITEELKRREIPMLIAHWDFHFYYKYHTGREAFSYEPEKHWPQTKTWRLLYGPTPTELQAYLPPDHGWRDNTALLLPGTPYTLIREDVYKSFRAAVDPRYNRTLYNLLWASVMNPSKPRPAFLYEKHQNDVKDEFSALE